MDKRRPIYISEAAIAALKNWNPKAERTLSEAVDSLILRVLPQFAGTPAPFKYFPISEEDYREVAEWADDRGCTMAQVYKWLLSENIRLYGEVKNGKE